MNKILLGIVSLMFIGGASLEAQTMQVMFCGKTDEVSPAKDGNGNDQRHKGALRLDFIRVGRLGQSRTSPFYNLGTSSGYIFRNSTWVDGCNSNQNQTYCTGCTTCSAVFDNSNAPIGIVEGRLFGNSRVRSQGNDLYLESTGDQNVVCYVTVPFDVSAEIGKRIEVNVGYEGTSQGGFSTKNVNFSYRYSNGNWTPLLNQNSNFLRVIDTAIFITRPVSVSNINAHLSIELSPNPVSEQLTVTIENEKGFDAMVSVIDINGKVSERFNHLFVDGINKIEIPVDHLSDGLYYLQITDQFGNSGGRKFVKN